MTTDANPCPLVEVIAGLAPIASRYDLILCDVWGVLHNGLEAHPGAGEALSRYRARGGSVVLISNAPRPGSAVLEQLDELRVPRAAYDAIVTSGDLTRNAIIERIGQTLHHIGPARDRPLFAGLELSFGDLERADYVVCTGLLDDERETAEDYRPTLRRMLERRLLMVCANPDLVVERGDALIPCAGALALLYEREGGAVFYAGKPHLPVYEAALAIGTRLNRGTPIPRERVLAVGDAIRTDIAGAVAAGMPSLLVADGIHALEMGVGQNDLGAGSMAQRWLAQQPVRPDAVIEALVWSGSKASIGGRP